eukprot:m.588782 g.588782  ORF g.588782 m.588782 type:complete len:58 (+) comp22366_c0_seq9:3230-3403(+)
MSRNLERLVFDLQMVSSVPSTMTEATEHANTCIQHFEHILAIADAIWLLTPLALERA